MSIQARKKSSGGRAEHTREKFPVKNYKLHGPLGNKFSHYIFFGTLTGPKMMMGTIRSKIASTVAINTCLYVLDPKHYRIQTRTQKEKVEEYKIIPFLFKSTNFVVY